MHLLPQTRVIESERNGPITVRQWMWHTSVHAGGFEQSGPYLTGLWRDTLRRMPAQFKVRRVLVVGLGGGSCVREVERRFPEAQTTVIEWDPVMISIAKELRLYAIEPEIIEGDLFYIVPTLKPAYDLVLIDAFESDQPEPRLAAPEIGRSLGALLSDDGRIAVNVSRTLGLVEAMGKTLSLVETWKFKDNTVALFGGVREGV